MKKKIKLQKINHSLTNFTVHDLGDDLSMEKKKFRFDRIKTTHTSSTLTKGEVGGFLGLSRYCRQWEPMVFWGCNTSLWTKSSVRVPLLWDPNMNRSPGNWRSFFKGFLTTKHFFWSICAWLIWTSFFSLLVVYGNHQKLITYYSLTFNSVAKAYPSCIRGIAAKGKFAHNSCELVLGSTLDPMVVRRLTENIQHFSAS